MQTATVSSWAAIIVRDGVYTELLIPIASLSFALKSKLILTDFYFKFWGWHIHPERSTKIHIFRKAIFCNTTKSWYLLHEKIYHLLPITRNALSLRNIYLIKKTYNYSWLRKHYRTVFEGRQKERWKEATKLSHQ